MTLQPAALGEGRRVEEHDLVPAGDGEERTVGADVQPCSGHARRAQRPAGGDVVDRHGWRIGVADVEQAAVGAQLDLVAEPGSVELQHGSLR